MILGEADTSPVSAESKHPLPAELFPGYRNEPLGLQGCNNTRHCKAPEENSVVRANTEHVGAQLGAGIGTQRDQEIHPHVHIPTSSISSTSQRPQHVSPNA